MRPTYSFATTSVPLGVACGVTSTTHTPSQIEQRLRGKFPDNRLMVGSGNPWWASHCLGHGCAEWSWRSVLAVTESVCDALGIDPNYRRMHRAGWSGYGRSPYGARHPANQPLSWPEVSPRSARCERVRAEGAPLESGRPLLTCRSCMRRRPTRLDQLERCGQRTRSAPVALRP